MLFYSPTTNAAKRSYLQRSVGVALVYIALVFAARLLINHSHPQGWPLYFVAVLPTAPLLYFAWVVGRYLREEKDEYQRDIVIRGMLWGTAAALAVTIFVGFLHSYGWQGQLPPFTEFMTFWGVAAVSRVAYSAADRRAGHD